MTYHLEVLSNEWGGTLRSGWRPAIAGTLNQTGLTDEEASTTDTIEETDVMMVMVEQEHPDEIRVVDGHGAIVRTWSADPDEA